MNARIVIKSQKMSAPITDAAISSAVARGEERKKSTPIAESVEYNSADRLLIFRFAGGFGIDLEVDRLAIMSEISHDSLSRVRLILGGTAVEVKDVDLHISISSLLRESHSLMRLAKQMVAASNGERTTEAKAQASRDNGMSGGRPKTYKAIIVIGAEKPMFVNSSGAVKSIPGHAIRGSQYGNDFVEEESIPEFQMSAEKDKWMLTKAMN